MPKDRLCKRCGAIAAVLYYYSLKRFLHSERRVVDGLIARFRDYAASFKGGGKLCDENIDLKVEHTLRVAAETRRLCRAEAIPERSARLALYAALLHDLSRFSQFRASGSFNDAESFDHGDRSAELAAADGWLAGLEHRSAEAVLTAVCWHNKPSLPGGLSPDASLLSRIVRDADKLDIFNVLLEHLADPRNPAVVFSLDASAGVTPEIAAAIAAGKQVAHRDMRTAADFIAAKLLWPFDLNFDWSRGEFLRRGYIDRLTEHLPEDEAIRRAADRAREHCRGRSLVLNRNSGIL